MGKVALLYTQVTWYGACSVTANALPIVRIRSAGRHNSTRVEIFILIVVLLNTRNVALPQFSIVCTENLRLKVEMDAKIAISAPSHNFVGLYLRN